MDQFAIAGYSGGNCMMCVIDNVDIFQTDYFGNRQQLIGKTAAGHVSRRITVFATVFMQLVITGCNWQ